MIFSKTQNIDYFQIEKDEIAFRSMLLPEAAERLSKDHSILNSLTIRDVKELQQNECIAQIAATKTNNLFQDFLSLTFCARSDLKSEQQKQEFIENNVLYITTLKEEAIRIVNLALTKIKEGAPFSVIIKPDTSTFHINESVSRCLVKTKEKKGDSLYSSILGKIEDPKALEKIKLMRLLYEPELTAIEEKKTDLYMNLFRSRVKKAQETKLQNAEKKLNDFQDLKHYFLFLSAKLNKDIDKVSVEEFESQTNQKAYLDFEEKKRIQLERKKEMDIEKSFLPNLPKKKVPPKIKAKKKKNHRSSIVKQDSVTLKSATPLTKIEDSSPVLHPSVFSKKAFFLDKRITRWFGATASEIQQFTDRVLLTTVHHYMHSTPEELEEQRIYHGLTGVDQLMSLTTENLQKYSTSYQFMHNGTLKNGRCFSAQLRHENIVEEGMIYVGIDDKRIYHAKFVPTSKSELSSTEIKPADLCLNLDGVDSLPNLYSEGQWVMNGGYSFDMEDDAIIWSIQDKTSLQYVINPLF